MISKKNYSLNEQRGKEGEEIVLELLKARFSPNNVHDTRAEYKLSLYDFWYLDHNGKVRYVDAKARCIKPHFYGSFISFEFSEERELHKYEKFKAETGCPFELWVVEATRGNVFVSEIADLRKPCVVGNDTFPFNIKSKTGEVKTVVSPQQFRTVIPLDDANRHLDKLRELYDVSKTVTIERTGDKVRGDARIKLVEYEFAPDGITALDINSIDGTRALFVKAVRLYTALSGLKDPGCNANSPIIKAAHGAKAKVYRFAADRDSGGRDWGTKPYLFCVDDVPNILAQYYAHYYRVTGEKQTRYNKAALELRKFFQETILPKYGLAAQVNRHD